jgi:hypothetical protein
MQPKELIAICEQLHTAVNVLATTAEGTLMQRIEAVNKVHDLWAMAETVVWEIDEELVLSDNPPAVGERCQNCNVPLTGPILCEECRTA